jgi:hypothetical protein
VTAPDTELRQFALKALANRAGSAAGAAAIAEAAQRAYDDLARVSAPLVGQVGVDALTGRTLYLAQRQYHWLGRTSEPDQWSGPLAQIVFCLEEQQDPAVALEAAGVVLGVLTGLLATLIGRPLTFGILQKAWPDAFTEARIGEQ